jgi:hypothetical protein
MITEADPTPLKPSAPQSLTVGVSAQEAPPTVATPALAAPSPGPIPSSSRLAELAAIVASIPDAPPAAAAERPKPAPVKSAAKPSVPEGKSAAKPGGTRLQTAEAKPSKRGGSEPAATSAKKAAAPVREPSRVWVQVAGGADKAALPREFDRLKTKAPKLLGGRTAWTAKLNATNRLLVGPFADAEAAQAFVNALRKADLGGFAWTSEAGEKVEKLPAK